MVVLGVNACKADAKGVYAAFESVGQGRNERPKRGFSDFALPKNTMTKYSASPGACLVAKTLLELQNHAAPPGTEGGSH